jgi:hypothetical protein
MKTGWLELHFGIIWDEIIVEMYENTQKKECHLKDSYENASFVLVNIIWIDGPNIALSNGENRRSIACSYQKLFAI